ncbi:unnamed protein product [Sphagnum troendelagicum]|uniref:Uncharacterized protein n=2 Tax=Sphagnum TaxID=13804 RepID=A0ABP0V428_9BRYO
MTETFFLCYVVTEMALNTVSRVSLEDTAAYTDKVRHNSVTEGPSSRVEGLNSGTEGSTSVTEKQKSGTEGSKSTTEKHDSDTEVEKVNWKPENSKSEQWILKLKSGLDLPPSYDERYRDFVMKLPDFLRKPEEHYTPQQWRFGLHNRDLEASKRVASTAESEALKIGLAAACNLKSDRWDEFCDNIVHDPEKIMLRSYGLHSSPANFTRKEVQSLLTLDALTLLLVLSSSALPNSIQEDLMEEFISWLEIGDLKIRALLKEGVAYSALRNDLFLCENQIPMALLKRVISKCYFLQGKMYSYTVLNTPYVDRRKEFLHTILKNLVCKMCSEIFVEPCPDKKELDELIDDASDVADFNDSAHIFACVYKILTTFDSKEAATKSRLHEDETKESASDWEDLPHGRSLGNYSKVVISPGTSPINLEQTGDCELQMSRIVAQAELNALHHLMPTIDNEPGGNLDDGGRMMNYEKGPDLNEIGPHRVTIENEPDWNEFPSQMDRSKIEPGRKVSQARMMEYKKARSDGSEVPQQMMEYVEKAFDTRMEYEKRFDGRKVRQARMMEYEKAFDGSKVPETNKKEEYRKGSDGRKMAEYRKGFVTRKGFDGSEVPAITRMAEYTKGSVIIKGFDNSEVPASDGKKMAEYTKGSVIIKEFDNIKVPETLMQEYYKQSHSNKIPRPNHSPRSDLKDEWKRLRSATDLKKAGLRIKKITGMMRQVAFDNGCLFLPIVQQNDRTESYFRNLAMYEVFDHYDKSRHAFADYLNLMLDLIKTPEDVAYLIDDCKVIQNLLVTHQNAFEMWQRLQSGLALPPYSKDYRELIVNPVNIQCESTLNVMRTEFYDTFCSKPWLAISVITAAVLLLATLIQTYVSVIGSDKMQPHFPRGG